MAVCDLIVVCTICFGVTGGLGTGPGVIQSGLGTGPGVIQLDGYVPNYSNKPRNNQQNPGMSDSSAQLFICL